MVEDVDAIKARITRRASMIGELVFRHARNVATQTLTPGTLVEQAMDIVELAQRLVDDTVIVERARGASWRDIGVAAGGITRQSAHKRWSHLDPTEDDADNGER
ncbi:MAG: hypothetical protein J2P17_01325 [Mycobacterium sp.]|nr:hypothetical protein [Mycobacterium sp.]